MSSVNASQISPAGEHHENCLGLGVGGIVLKVENDAQIDSVKFPGPVALFAGIARRY
jgi:hypothetical protein